MIVTVEDDAHVVLHEQLMNGLGPAGTVLLEAIGAVGVPAAPFVERRGFRPAAALAVSAADQMMDEDEFELRLAGFERALEPLILFRAERALPVVAAAALASA